MTQPTVTKHSEYFSRACSLSDKLSQAVIHSTVQLTSHSQSMAAIACCVNASAKYNYAQVYTVCYNTKRAELHKAVGCVFKKTERLENTKIVYAYTIARFNHKHDSVALTVVNMSSGKH